MIEKGFSENRTVRVLGVGILIFGVSLLILGFALSYVDGFASGLVERAVARYGNFTGKFALNNFAEDRHLMDEVLAVRDGILPKVNVAIPLAFAFGCVFSLGGFCFLIFPGFFAGWLLRIRVLKRVGDEGSSLKVGDWVRCHKKALLASSAVLILSVSVGILVGKFSNPARLTPEKVAELERETARFCGLQRKYYASHKTLGTWEQLGYEASDSEFFQFEKAGRFGLRARNLEGWESCPDSSAWKVSFEVKGVFSKELKIYVSRPDNAACEALTPEFRKHVMEACGKSPSSE